MNLQERINDAKEEAISMLDYDEDYDIGDIAHEIADSFTPIYTSDIMELAAQDIRLATDEPQLGPAFDGSPTPVNIIATNIYERIFDEVYNAISEWKEQREEQEEME